MKKIGIALGSGGARGWANVGVLEALLERDIEPVLVAGTSMGSIVGAAYAANRLEQVKEVALDLAWDDLLYYAFDVSWRGGVLDGKKIMRFIGEHIQAQDFKELDKPFRCVASDLSNGCMKVFSEGDLLQAIRASISIPGVFSPVPVEDGVLVDGGVVNPVPVDVVRDMGADVVIAVDVNHGRLMKEPDKKEGEISVDNWSTRGFPAMQKLQEKALHKKKEFKDLFASWTSGRRDLPNIVEVLTNSILLMEAQITELNFKTASPDILIRPPVADLGVLEFHRARQAIQAGYDATIEVLEDQSLLR